MDIKYLTVFGFVYKEISGECDEFDWRRIDFQKDDPIFVTGNLIVYMEFDFPLRKYGEDVKKPQYSGKFTVRRIKQTIRNQTGIAKGYVALLLEEIESTNKIQKEVRLIIDKYSKEGGLIPIPQ